MPAYLLEHFTNDTGLPVNGVTSIAWDDERQLLWISTQAGLVCWDGQRFEQVKGGEGRTSTIYPETIAGKKLLHYISYDFGVYDIQYRSAVYKGELTDRLYPCTSFGSAMPESMDSIAAMIDADKNRALWPGFITPLSNDGSALINFNGIYLKKGKKIKCLMAVGQEAYLVKAGNRAWVADKHQLYNYNTKTERLDKISISGLPHNYYQNCAYVASTNTDYPISCCNGTLYALMPVGNGLQATILCDGLPLSASITCLQVLGQSGCIAFSDVVHGAFLLRRPVIRVVETALAKEKSIRMTTEGQLLLSDGRLLLANGTVIDSNGRLTKLPIHANYDLFRSGHIIFYSQNDTALQYDEQTGVIKTALLHDKSQWVTFAATAGNVYALSNFGIYRIDQKRAVRLLQTGAFGDVRRYFINPVGIEYSPGVLAIALGNKLGLYDTRTNKLDTIQVSDRAPIRAIRKFKDCLMLGTYGEGIFAWKDRKVIKLPIDRGGSLKYAHTFMPDGEGYCFISTNNGLFQVSVKALLAAVDNPQVPVYYHYYGRQDGAVNTEFNGAINNAAVRMPNGALSFITMHGLAQIQPDRISTKLPTGTILVDSVSVDKRKVSYKSTELAEIAAGTQHISFHIGIPYWGNAENLYTWYRLRGDAVKDTSWLPFNSVTQQDFSFTSLRPDAYRFEIKVLSGFNPGEAKYLQIPFTVLKPWYFRWYSLTLWIVLWASFIILLLRARVARSRQREAFLEHTVALRTADLKDKVSQLDEANHLKSRLISVISHNIITPLRYMHRAAGSLRDEQQLLSPALKGKAISSIKSTAQELELLAVNLLNWIKTQYRDYGGVQPQRFSVDDVLHKVKGLLDLIAQEREQTILITSCTVPPVTQYKDALQTILYNLTLNASIYSGKGIITISCACTDSRYELVVADKGVGMSATTIETLLSKVGPAAPDSVLSNYGQGFGYLIIHDLLRLIGGQLSIESHQRAGTTVTIQFSSLSD